MPPQLICDWIIYKIYGKVKVHMLIIRARVYSSMLLFHQQTGFSFQSILYILDIIITINKLK